MTPDPAGALTIDGFGPLPVAAPATTAEVGEIVRRCAAEGRAVYPIGGRTMLDYGTPPSRPGVAVDLRRLDQVIDYPARDMTITVQAGITVARLQEVLRAEGQQLPIDVPDPERATLGGVIAANVSGPRRYAYGTLRDYVIGISVVNDRGEETKAGGRVVKNVAGYDLMKLYTGSLGTLGIITQVTLKLKPLVEELESIAFDCSRECLGPGLDLVHRTQTRPVSVEARGDNSGWRVVVGFEGSAEAVRWQVQRLSDELAADGFSALPAGFLPYNPAAPRPGAMICRVNLPPSAVADYCQCALTAAPGAAVSAHAANGIVRVFAPHGDDRARAVAVANGLLAAATEHQGNLVVEHCPSEWKPHLPVWGRPRGDRALMKAIKRQLDPNNLFNPGRFVTDQPANASS
jgi:glycolate oxidase FAD binding subunit